MKPAPEGENAPNDWRALGVQLFAGALFALGGVSVVEFVVVPVLIAVHVAVGRYRMAGALIAATMAGAMLSRMAVMQLWPELPPAHWSLAAYYGCVAAMGAPVGLGLARGWSYGRTVAIASTLVTGALVFTIVLVCWDWWLSEASEVYKRLAALRGESPGTQRQEAVLSLMHWLLVDHWAELGLGVVFWQLLCVICLNLSLTARRYRALSGRKGFAGSFSEMRVPEWAVWLLILAACGWFADNRWSGSGIRPVVWNTAAALAGLYWLNGISVMSYALRVAQASAAVSAAAFAGMMLFCGLELPCFIGLFDTWGDFRRKLRAWDIIRRQGSGPGEA